MKINQIEGLGEEIEMGKGAELEPWINLTLLLILKKKGRKKVKELLLSKVGTGCNAKGVCMQTVWLYTSTETLRTLLLAF